MKKSFHSNFLSKKSIKYQNKRKIQFYFSEKKKEILKFFELENYEKVRINVFDKLETLNN